MTDSSTDSIHLCYDLKGIQSFIFAVPKLKYICGGSAIIDQFDRETVLDLGLPNCERIFSGGGKGAFRCATPQDANALKNKLVEKAHEVGLSISFGVDPDYSEAASNADESYPFLPDSLEGHPCEASGLYPVAKKGSVHSILNARDWGNRENRVSRRVEKELLVGLKRLDGTPFPEEEIAFFHNVDANDDWDPCGKIGAKVLGKRNRWAVIAMDGNDMGNQHRKAVELFAGKTDEHLRWLAYMSGALDACSRGACKEAIQAVVDQWSRDLVKDSRSLDEFREKGTNTLILPVRPLLVGGDDILVLCHTRYADLFFVSAVEAFSRISAEKAKGYGPGQLWPATGNRLSITGGILYAPVGLPLSTAIPFAQALEASAKRRGRDLHKAENAPTPPCIDWESVTEGVIETPAARRNRELRFREPLDEDPQGSRREICLTQRPMTLEQFQELQQDVCGKYTDIPGSIRHGVLSGLRQGFWDRKVYLARIGKHQELLARHLAEGRSPKSEPPPGSRWKDMEAERSTDVVDALLLLEETARAETETIGD